MLDGGDLAELARDEGPREGGLERIAILVKGVGAERRQDIAAGELLAQIEHVGAGRAEGQRTIADRFEIAALAEIERDGDDFGAMRLLEPSDAGGRIERRRYRRARLAS